jgi:MYXO-CTERM domain-containing protein
MTARSTAALVIALSLFLIQPAKADTISLASVGTSSDSGQTNSMGATIAISPNTAWLAALPGSQWVSFAATGNTSGAGFMTVANGTVVNFFDTFNISGTPTSGTVTVMADDSAAVLLNGVQVMAEGTSVGNTYATCSNFGIGCLSPTTITLPASLLKSGSNTLEFEVAQRNGSSFGLDYLGSILTGSGTVTSTPEPAAGFMLGFGLLALSALALRRRRLDC